MSKRRHDWGEWSRGWRSCLRDGCEMSRSWDSKAKRWRYYLKTHPSEGGGWVKRAGECKGRDSHE